MKFKKVYIEITNICNKNCPFCIKDSRKKEEMSPLKFEHVINEIKQYTNYIYLHVKGEPLLHSHIDEILSICDKYKIFVNITTNGSLIEKNKDILKNHKCIRQVNISTHSITNIEDIKSILSSIDYIRKDNNFYTVYRYWTLKDSLLLIDNEVINEIVKYYKIDDKLKDIQEKDNIRIDEYTYINKELEFEWPSLNNKYYSETGYCLGLTSHIAILSNGTVVPCCLDVEGKIPLGNIFEKSLKSILESDFTQDIVNNFKNNKKICELCKHCSFNYKK